MDIAGLSVVLAQSQIKTDASLAIMKQTKDLMSGQGKQLMEMIEKSTTTHPYLGHNIDIQI